MNRTSEIKSKQVLQLIILTFVLCVATVSSAQNSTSKLLRGTLISDGKSTAGVDIVNLVNEKASISNAQGNFTIEAKADDLLVISGKNFEYMRYSVTNDDITSGTFVVTLITKAIELEETIVNPYGQINAVSMGIIPAGQKTYTPAERKLYTSSSGPVDLIAGLITGSISRKKKEVAVERKEFILERLDILYTDSYYSNKLKIPVEQIGSFKFFAAEDNALRESISTKSKDLIEFDLSRLANQFLKL